MQFQLNLPFRSAAQVASGIASGNSRQVAGGQYHLTYLDEVSYNKANGVQFPHGMILSQVAR